MEADSPPWAGPRQSGCELNSNCVLMGMLGDWVSLNGAMCDAEVCARPGKGMGYWGKVTGPEVLNFWN